MVDTTLLDSVSVNLTLLKYYCTLRFSYQGELEWQLLEGSDSDDDTRDPMRLSSHDLATAPLLTREAFTFIKGSGRATQYGVLGRTLAIQCVYFFARVMHSH